MSIDRASLDRVKSELGIILPVEYERLVLDIPSDIPDAEDLHISISADWLIGQNQELRTNPSFFFFREEPWPEHFYVIGEDGNGNAFYLDLRERSNPVVYFLDHEQPDKDHIISGSTVLEWVNVVRAQMLEYRANATARGLDRSSMP